MFKGLNFDILNVDEISRNTLDDMNALQGALADIEDITYVQGAAPEELLINGNVVNYEDIPSETVVSYYSAFEDFSPLKIGGDINYFVFTLFINENFSNSSIKSIEDTLENYEYQSYISGDSYNQLKITDYIVKILLILPPLALLVIFLVFRWQMGALKPTFLSVLPAGIGSLWTFGLIGWIGNEVSILTAVVPIFIIVIGSADGLHFMAHYQDSKKEGKDNKKKRRKRKEKKEINFIMTSLNMI